MKKIIFTSLILLAECITDPVKADISLGYDGSPSSFVLSVFDPSTGATYYKNLQIDYTAFLQTPSGQINLGLDPAFAAFLGQARAQFNVSAFSPLKDDLSNKDSWGALLTLPSGSLGLSADWVSIDALRQTMQIFYSYLSNDSGVIPKSTPGAIGSMEWSENLNGKISSSSFQKVGSSSGFYFLSNPSGAPSAGLIRKAGEWSLGLDGWLKFSQGHSLLNNQPPVANAGADQVVLVGNPVTLNGENSYDPDESPAPLTYSWIQTEGPTVSLSNSGSNKTGFTPDALTTYGFRLTVSDGKESAAATVKVATTAFQIAAAGTYRRSGQSKSPIKWSFAKSLISESDRIRIRYTRDGSHFKGIMSQILAKKGGYSWKPKFNIPLGDGQIEVCVKSHQSKASYCDSATIRISP